MSDCATCKGKKFVKCPHCSPCGCVVCAGFGTIRCPFCKPRKEGEPDPRDSFDAWLLRQLGVEPDAVPDDEDDLVPH